MNIKDINDQQSLVTTSNDEQLKIQHKDQKLSSLQDNKLLNLAISKLPSNYNFEIHKTILKINSLREELLEKQEIEIDQPLSIAIQLPDGFAYLSVILSDIIQTFSSSCETIILGDITYGACCIDDLGCQQLGVHLLLHYGHSCLIPITESAVRVMYIFVDIMVDVDCCSDIINNNFSKENKLYIMGSIQYNNSVF